MLHLCRTGARGAAEDEMFIVSVICHTAGGEWWHSCDLHELHTSRPFHPGFGINNHDYVGSLFLFLFHAVVAELRAAPSYRCGVGKTGPHAPAQVCSMCTGGAERLLQPHPCLLQYVFSCIKYKLAQTVSLLKWSKYIIATCYISTYNRFTVSLQND